MKSKTVFRRYKFLTHPAVIVAVLLIALIAFKDFIPHKALQQTAIENVLNDPHNGYDVALSKSNTVINPDGYIGTGDIGE